MSCFMSAPGNVYIKDATNAHPAPRSALAHNRHVKPAHWPQHACVRARHYTFYLWKDVVNAHPAARYALAPVL